MNLCLQQSSKSKHINYPDENDKSTNKISAVEWLSRKLNKHKELTQLETKEYRFRLLLSDMWTFIKAERLLEPTTLTSIKELVQYRTIFLSISQTEMNKNSNMYVFRTSVLRTWIKTNNNRASKITWQLRALGDHPEDPRWNPSTHVIAHNHLELQSQGTWCIFLPPLALHTRYTDADTQNTHTCKIINWFI